MLRQLPPWSSHAISRLSKTPKLHFLDTGLLAALRGHTPVPLRKNTSPERAHWGPVLAGKMCGVRAAQAHHLV